MRNGAYSTIAAWIERVVLLCSVSGGHWPLSKHRASTCSRVILSACGAFYILLGCGHQYYTFAKRSDVCTSRGCRRSSPNSSEIGQFALQLQPGRKGGTIASLESLQDKSQRTWRKLNRLADGIVRAMDLSRLCGGRDRGLHFAGTFCLMMCIIALGLETPSHKYMDFGDFSFHA